jgi:hypothetical protein
MLAGEGACALSIYLECSHLSIYINIEKPHIRVDNQRFYSFIFNFIYLLSITR